MADLPELDGVRHEFVDVAGVRLHVAMCGPDDAPPLLLVHGWPQSWWAWRRVIPALCGEFRVIAPDLRGHGWSEAPPSGYDKQQLASDLLGLLDALAIERATWIGHDWGGWAGFLAALRAPERVERMLALCIPHLWAERDPRRLAVMLSYQGPLSMPGLGPRVADRILRSLLQFGRGGEPLAAADVELFASQITPAVSVAMYRTFLAREIVPIATGRYAQDVLSVPTTLIIGGDDRVTHGTPAGTVPGQPKLTVEIAPGVAHWLPEQRPERVIDWAASRASSAA